MPYFDRGELPEYGQVQVKYTNIDFSRHTNNIEYIRFMLDTYSVRKLEARPVKEMEIIYANQSFEDDVLIIRRGSLDYTEYAFRKQYMGFRNFLFKRSFVDMDYVYGTLSCADGENPLDYPALRDNPMERTMGCCH